MNDKFHMGVAAILILVYLFLVLKGTINSAGFEYMVGSIVGGLFGFKIGQQNGGSNVANNPSGSEGSTKQN